jgi:hypothetical protein
MGRTGACLLARGAALVVTLALASPCRGDRLARAVVPGGGSLEAASEHYRLSGALGQPAVGGCASEGYVLACGFWGVPFAPTTAASPPAAPAAFRLLGVRPNPSTSEAAIVFDLSAPSPVEVRVFDVGGRMIRTLATGGRAAGRHVLRWDGRDDVGAPAAPGIYVIRASTGPEHALSKFIRLR